MTLRGSSCHAGASSPSLLALWRATNAWVYLGAGWLAAWGTKAQPSGLQAADSKVLFAAQRCLQGRAEAGMAPGIASLLGFFPVAILPPTPLLLPPQGRVL